MVFVNEFGARRFFLGLLLLVLLKVWFVHGQQVGASLELLGVNLPNNSLVDLRDLLDVPLNGQNPTPKLNLPTLHCFTDLVDCCNSPHSRLGEWYFPNGTALIFDNTSVGTTYRRNRGPNGLHGPGNPPQMVYGVVRLYRRGDPPERGRFRCEVPTAANPTVLYVNILNIGQVTITPSGGSNTGIVGTSFSLVCSATVETQTDSPTPNFEWFFGPNNVSVPSGATPMATVMGSGNIYTSTLQFSPLQESHVGMYTCRLEGNARLAVNAMVTVNRISVGITTSGSPTLGENMYTLTCDVSGADSLTPTLTYQWTKDNGTQIQVGTNSNTLSFSSLSLFDAGRYTCSISSPDLVNDITSMNFLDITFQIEQPTSVTLINSNIQPIGSDVTLICTVLLKSGPEIDIPLTVNFDLSRTDPVGSPLSTTNPSVSGSNYTITATVSSFERDDSGIYTCTANVRTVSPNSYLTESSPISNTVQLTTGVYLVLRGEFIGNNSNVNIRDIGLSIDSPNGALQCITDRSPCCTSPRLGEWYLPDGGIVQGSVSTTDFYRNREDGGIVSLNRPIDTMSPIGRFCCEVADYTGNNQTVCVNIGGVSVSSFGSPTAGETYTLECTAGGSTAGFQWLGPPDGMTPVDTSSPAISIGSNSTVTQLQFSPLQQSHNGSYSCSVSTGGLNTISNPLIISVNAPSISVQVGDGGDTLTTGQKFDLTCTVLGAENINPTIAYQWIKSNGTQSQVGTKSNTLSFSPLRLSNASQYICMVTITSSYLTGDFVAMDSQDIRVQIPAPSLTVTSNTANSIQLVGADVTLTCTVKFGTEVVESDLSLLMVDAQLSRDGTPLTLAGLTVTGTTFTYTIQLDSFGRNDSGNYTCTATVRPKPTSSYLVGDQTISNQTRVTTGVYLSLMGDLYPSNSYILITEIGQTLDGEEEGGALLCYTDNVQCCSNTSTNRGRWFLPDQSEVGTKNEEGAFYVDGGPSVVRLHRRNNTTSLTGLFCCEVPDAVSVITRSCVNIVKMLPTTVTDATPSSTVAVPGSSNTLTAPIAGAVGAAVALLIAFILIIVAVAVLRRRRSGKPYKVSSNKQPVAYSKSSNGERVHVFGAGKNIDTHITEGEGVYFKIKVSGVPQPTVTWYHDGEPIKSDYAREIEADGSLIIPSTELKHSGVYKAVVANQHGSEEREVKLSVIEEGGNSIATAFDEMVTSRPIPISEFGKYVSELHANSNQPFKDLYQALESGENGHGTTYASALVRKPLNRFGNIVVYDDNRIVLQPMPDVADCQEDYINACYVDGYSNTNKFIATQGPLPKTVVDFWRLIWQERPPTIVMVTNVKEGNRIKCQQYWPDSGKKEFGPFQVIITDQQIFADYTVRMLSLSLGSGRSHKVTQYHFTAWPDHGVPDYATPILAFHRRVKAQHHPSRGPMVVHCSAGVGRTGTFIVIDNILEQIEKEQVVDIPGAITKIRHKRMKMVQTHEQFTFIHDAILESVTCGDTQISATNLRTTISKMTKKDIFQYQMKILEQVSPNPDEVQCNTALSHPKLNRGNQFLPADRWRFILKGEQPDYIHAVNINGYKHQKAFIIAQGPMDSTVRNFWKMILDRKCAVVVMVSGLMEEGQEASTQYWPSSGTCQYGEYTVDLLGEEPLEGFTIRDLSVIHNESEKAHKVTQFHITCWTAGGRCSNLKSVTDVIEEMTKVQIRSGNKPIVVHCNDTVTRSGMFCAISTTIERCKTEGVVDVFQVVKALRVQKPGAVPNVDHYKVIFEAVLVFLESFDTYANFQM